MFHILQSFQRGCYLGNVIGLPDQKEDRLSLSKKSNLILYMTTVFGINSHTNVGLLDVFAVDRITVFLHCSLWK